MILEHPDSNTCARKLRHLTDNDIGHAPARLMVKPVPLPLPELEIVFKHDGPPEAAGDQRFILPTQRGARKNAGEKRATPNVYPGDLQGFQRMTIPDCLREDTESQNLGILLKNGPWRTGSFSAPTSPISSINDMFTPYHMPPPTLHIWSAPESLTCRMIPDAYILDIEPSYFHIWSAPEEIDVLSELKHPNIVQNYGCEILNEWIFSLKGSPYWMAPELLQLEKDKDGNPDLGLAVDIWSLGCTIIEMIDGRPPWSEYEGPAAMFKVMKENPQIPENLSLEGKDFLNGCFTRNPAERPSASMLLEHEFLNTSHGSHVPYILMDKEHLHRELDRLLVTTYTPTT